MLAVVGGVDGRLRAGEEVGFTSCALHIVHQDGQISGAIVSRIQYLKTCTPIKQNSTAYIHIGTNVWVIYKRALFHHKVVKCIEYF